MKRRRLDLDPEFTPIGRVDVKKRQYKLLGTSRKRSINFAASLTDSDSKSTSSSPKCSPTLPIEENIQGYEIKSPSPIPIEENIEEENVESEDEAVKNLITLARSAPRRPSVKRNVDFFDIKEKEYSTAPESKGKEVDPIIDPHKCDELLFDFAHAAGASNVFHLLADMFNKPIPLEALLLQHAEYLSKERGEYLKGVEKGKVEAGNIMCVHLADCFPGKKGLNALYKKYNQLTTSYKPFWCTIHKNNCKIITEPIGFICYLHCLYTVLPETGEELLTQDVIEEDADDELGEDEGDAVEFEEPMDHEGEAEDIKQVDILAIKTTIVKAVESVQTENLDTWGLVLPILPEFNIEGRAYLLLSDIQNIFNIREDHALSKIAKFEELHEGWVLEDTWEDEQLECNYNAKDCHRISFNQAKEYRDEGNVPDEKSFLSVQKKCGYDKLKDSCAEWMRLKESTKESILEGSSSINLFRDETFCNDEGVQSLVEESDEFLQRHKRTFCGKDAALSHYLKQLAKARIIIYHNSMSNEGLVGTFVFKTLSCFLGGTVIPKNYGKVILIDKMSALDIFGYMPGYSGSRRSYFHTYTAAALSTGIENIEELEEYGKHKLLRYKTHRPLAIEDVKID